MASRDSASVVSRLVRAAGFVVLVLFVGCGKNEPSGGVQAPTSPAASSKPENDSGEKRADVSPLSDAVLSKSKSSALRPGVPQTADAAVSAVLAGIRDNRLEAVWDFLPETFQSRLAESVREFGRSMDADVWRRLMTVLQKAVKVLETKKAFITAGPFWQSVEPANARQLQEHWDDVVGLLATLVHSELADLEKLKQFDGRRFLAGTGAKAISHLKALSATVPNNPFQDLGQVSVKLKSSAGDSAVVTMELPGQPPQDHEFAVVDGKWFPKSWIASGPQLEALQPMVAKALQTAALSTRKEAVLKELEGLEQSLDELLAADTAEKFNNLVSTKVVPYVAQRLAAARGGATPTNGSPPMASAVGLSGHVTVSVTVTPVAAARDQHIGDLLMAKLAAASDAPEQSVVYEPEVREGQRVYRITPVSDVAAFAKRIDFGSVVSLDPVARSLAIAFNATAGEWQPKRAEPAKSSQQGAAKKSAGKAAPAKP